MKNLPRILIIGANGFLARELAKTLSGQKYHLDAVIKNNRDKLNPGFFNSIYSKENLEKIPDHYDWVFLLAACIPYGGMDTVDEPLIDSNVFLPALISKQFSKAKIIYSSSVSAFGEPRENLNEHSPSINPLGYGLTKLLGEKIIHQHPSFAIVRFSSIYGPGMSSKTFLPLIIANAKNEKKIILYGDGQRRQDYIHAKDAAKLLVHVAKNLNNQTCLGVSGVSYSNEQVAKIIQSYWPHISIHFKGEDPSSSSSYTSLILEKELDFKCETSLSQGIKEIL